MISLNSSLVIGLEFGWRSCLRKTAAIGSALVAVAACIMLGALVVAESVDPAVEDSVESRLASSDAVLERIQWPAVGESTIAGRHVRGHIVDDDARLEVWTNLVGVVPDGALAVGFPELNERPLGPGTITGTPELVSGRLPERPSEIIVSERLRDMLPNPLVFQRRAQNTQLDVVGVYRPRRVGAYSAFLFPGATASMKETARAAQAASSISGLTTLAMRGSSDQRAALLREAVRDRSEPEFVEGLTRRLLTQIVTRDRAEQEISSKRASAYPRLAWRSILPLVALVVLVNTFVTSRLMVPGIATLSALGIRGTPVRLGCAAALALATTATSIAGSLIGLCLGLAARRWYLHGRLTHEMADLGHWWIWGAEIVFAAVGLCVLTALTVLYGVSKTAKSRLARLRGYVYSMFRGTFGQLFLLGGCVALIVLNVDGISAPTVLMCTLGWAGIAAWGAGYLSDAMRYTCRSETLAGSVLSRYLGHHRPVIRGIVTTLTVSLVVPVVMLSSLAALAALQESRDVQVPPKRQAILVKEDRTLALFERGAGLVTAALGRDPSAVLHELVDQNGDPVRVAVAGSVSGVVQINEGADIAAMNDGLPSTGVSEALARDGVVLLSGDPKAPRVQQVEILALGKDSDRVILSAGVAQEPFQRTYANRISTMLVTPEFVVRHGLLEAGIAAIAFRADSAEQRLAYGAIVDSGLTTSMIIVDKEQGVESYQGGVVALMLILSMFGLATGVMQLKQLLAQQVIDQLTLQALGIPARIRRALTTGQIGRITGLVALCAVGAGWLSDVARGLVIPGWPSVWPWAGLVGIICIGAGAVVAVPHFLGHKRAARQRMTIDLSDCSPKKELI